MEMQLGAYYIATKIFVSYKEVGGSYIVNVSVKVPEDGIVEVYCMERRKKDSASDLFEILVNFLREAFGYPNMQEIIVKNPIIRSIELTRD